MPRSIWNGALSFAGIDVPVKVFGAADPQGVQFRELHEPDGAEIAHELVDADGRKVDRKQVVKGFEVRSGEYVVLDDDELKAASAPKRKTVDIEHFVPARADRPRRLRPPVLPGPQDGGEEAYAVLAAALRKTGRVGVGRVVLRSREQLVAVVEADQMLRLHTMRFADELVDPEHARPPPAAPQARRAAAQDGRAARRRLSGKFQPGRYRDTYRDRVLDLVKRKAKGEEIDTERAQAPEPSDDLMAALEASLKGSKR